MRTRGLGEVALVADARPAAPSGTGAGLREEHALGGGGLEAQHDELPGPVVLRHRARDHAARFAALAPSASVGLTGGGSAAGEQGREQRQATLPVVT